MLRKTIALGAIAGLLLSSAPSTFAQTDDYNRLYDEFLRQLNSQPAEPRSDVAPATPEPTAMPQVSTATQTSIEVNPQSMVQIMGDQMLAQGLLIRGDGGAYFLETDEGTYRVYGSEASREIVRAGGRQVFLSGKPARVFKDNKEVLVGITVYPGGVQVLNAPNTSSSSSTAPSAVQSNNGMMQVQGVLVREDDGRFSIKANGQYWLVFGTDASREIVQATGMEVILTGQEAISYKSGKRAVIGISVMPGGVEVLNARDSVSSSTAPSYQEESKMMPGDYGVFYGEIVIDQQRPYLLEEGNGPRILLNSEKWRMAFENAYKGIVVVEGYLTENGGIRYVNIYR